VKEDQIVAAIQDTGKLDSPEHAHQAAVATLQVLGQRLRGGESADLAAQLPPGLAEALPQTGPGQRFDVAEFYRRVAQAEGRGCSPQQARQHARAVAAALKVGLSAGEWNDLTAQLPDDYADLLGTEPVQH
jgi:uncharacterized protein (DUF2267 family)